MDSKTVASRAHHKPRLEDDALLRGLGRYAADIPLAGQAQATNNPSMLEQVATQLDAQGFRESASLLRVQAGALQPQQRNCFGLTGDVTCACEVAEVVHLGADRLAGSA